MAVIAEALTWLRTPFHMNAAVKGAGVDCGRLLTSVYGAAGLPVPYATGHFPRDWHLNRSDERMMAFLTQFAHEVKAPGPGDIAVFKEGLAYSHSAIVIDWPIVIHAHWNVGVEWSDASKEPLASDPVLFFSPFQAGA